VVALRNAAVAGDEDAVWAAIAFLDADPYLFRSGYMKRRLLKDLRRIALTREQQEMLADIALRLIDFGPRGVGYFAEFAKLVATIATGPTVGALQARLSGTDPRVMTRARFVLNEIRTVRSASARPSNVSATELP
jgi:hypothetical protein